MYPYATVRSRRKTPLIMTMCAAMVLVVSLFVGLTLVQTGGHGSSGDSQLVHASYVSHAPITIDSDSDFVTQGWPGNGTAANPYVISGLDIDGGATANDCIDIRNTTVHFLVEGNYVHNPVSNYNWGAINIRNVTNGSLVNNIVSQFQLGILVSFSENVTVMGNNCSAPYYAAGGYGYGVYISSSERISVVDNYCYWNVVGGLYLRWVNDSSIMGNLCIIAQQYGIVVRGCSGNTFSGNNVSENMIHGIFMYDAPSEWNNITDNVFYNNSQYAIRSSLSGSINNRIWNNTFVGNNGAGSTYDSLYIQAYDAGTGNWWNTSGTPHGYGNFWGDWQSPDVNSDGIVDNPYVLAGSGVQDYYPLTVPSQPIPEGNLLVFVAGTVFIVIAMFMVERKRQGS
jgi:parallel beta-helix repeat protein